MSTEHGNKRKRPGPDAAADGQGSGGPTTAADGKLVATLQQCRSEMRRARAEMARANDRLWDAMLVLHGDEAQGQGGTKHLLSRGEELDGRCQRLEARCEALHRSVQLLTDDLLPTGDGQGASMECKEEQTGPSRRSMKLEDVSEGLSRLDNDCYDLDARCDSLKRLVRKLVKHQRWEYPDIAHSCDEEATVHKPGSLAWKMDRFLSRLQPLVLKMRRGTYGHSIQLHNIFERGTLIRWDALFCHEATHPHWREFANAIQLSHHFNGSGIFSIRNIKLPLPILNRLGLSLRTKKFKKFILEGNGFENPRDGINFAVGILGCDSVKEFEWENNPIDRDEDINSLLECIRGNRTLESASLKNCFGTNVPGSARMGSRYPDLQLNCIPDFIRRNSPLEKLCIQSNHLDDHDAALIADALLDNTNLRELKLDGNNFTTAGKSSFRKACFDRSTLNALSDCNHTCRVYIDPSFMSNSRSDCPHCTREFKLYTALVLGHREGKNEHLLRSEFGDDYRKFVPPVLECVWQYSQHSIRSCDPRFGPRAALPIIHGLLRATMPELCECRGMHHP